jgi:hypothetical protein
MLDPKVTAAPDPNRPFLSAFGQREQLSGSPDEVKSSASWPGANLRGAPGRRRPSASVGSPAKASSKSSLLRNVDVDLDISRTCSAAQRYALDMDFELVAPDKSWRWHIIEISMASFLGRYVDHTV